VFGPRCRLATGKRPRPGPAVYRAVYREVVRSLGRACLRGRPRARPASPACSRSGRRLASSRNRPAWEGRSSRQYRSAIPAISTPEPHATLTEAAVPRDRDRTVILGPRSPGAYPVFVADLDRVHHDDPPSRPGDAAVSVSLRHQRSSVTLQRPPLASRRSATGRTRSPFCTTAPCPPGQDRRPDQRKRPTGRGAEGMERSYTRQTRTDVRQVTRG